MKTSVKKEGGENLERRERGHLGPTTHGVSKLKRESRSRTAQGTT